MPFTETFGGQNIFPSQLTLLNLALTVNTTLQWPVEQAVAGQEVFADIIRVTPSGGGLSITMPDARNASNGQATLVDNVGGSSVNILDNVGGALGTVPSGQVWQFYLVSNATQAGTWRSFQFGTGTSSASAASLAGAGLVAITTTLNAQIVPETVGGTPYSIVDADRAKAKIWTGGVGTFNFPDPATLGSAWFCWLRNSGTGDLTVKTAAAYINTPAVTSVTLGAGESLLMVSAGTFWFTMARGSGVSGSFDYTSISAAGSGDLTLSGAQLNRISYRFTGVLAGARNIVVPNTIQQYWVSNATTGAFSFTVKTAAGLGVVVPQGSAMILSCDGTNVVAWEGAPLTGVVSVGMGGLGLATVVQGDLLYGSATDVYSRLAKDANATRYLANTGASNNPQWNQVNLVNGVSGDLPFSSLAQGSALSVLGVTGNSVADVASIGAGSDGQVLRRSGTSVAFGALDLSSVNAVTNDLPDGNLSANVPLKNATNAFSGSNSFTLGNLLLDGAEVGYNGFPFDDDSPHTTDYTLEANDRGRCVFYSNGHGAGDTVTIPSNGSGTFAGLGITILIVNDDATDTLELAIDTDTLYLAGTTSTGPFNIQPKGAVLIYRTQNTEWIAIPLGQSILYPASAETVYAGYVGSDGTTGNRLPAGWSASGGGGTYTVTHNLGLSNGLDLSYAVSVINSSGNTNAYGTGAPGVNSFDVGTVNSGTGAATAQAFAFIAKRNS